MVEVQDEAALLQAARQNVLTDDVLVMMPPILAWFQGIDTLRVAFGHSWEMNPRPAELVDAIGLPREVPPRS